MWPYSVRMPSAVSTPSGVSQVTLAVSLPGSAHLSFRLGHLIFGGSISKREWQNKVVLQPHGCRSPPISQDAVHVHVCESGDSRVWWGPRQRFPGFPIIQRSSPFWFWHLQQIHTVIRLSLTSHIVSRYKKTQDKHAFKSIDDTYLFFS